MPQICVSEDSSIKGWAVPGGRLVILYIMHGAIRWSTEPHNLWLASLLLDLVHCGRPHVAMCLSGTYIRVEALLCLCAIGYTAEEAFFGHEGM